MLAHQLKEKDLGEEIDHGPERLVCHFFVQGTPVAAIVDELFDTLAHAYLGTKFARVQLARNSAWPAQLQVHLPALVCFKSGALTVRARHASFVCTFVHERSLLLCNESLLPAIEWTLKASNGITCGGVALRI
eukprot:1186474-Prorocentrum_minimum.AAC.5